MPHQPIDFDKLTVLYVYGTLRPGIKEHVVDVPGVMYDLGFYPGVLVNPVIVPRNSFVRCEKVFVTDEELAEIDGYEGYHAKSPTGSLFVRTPFRDGFIYEYNQPLERRMPIPTNPADWLKYRNLSGAGSAAYMVNPRRQGQIAALGISTCPGATKLIGFTKPEPTPEATAEPVSAEPPKEVGVAA